MTGDAALAPLRHRLIGTGCRISQPRPGDIDQLTIDLGGVALCFAILRLGEAPHGEWISVSAHEDGEILQLDISASWFDALHHLLSHTQHLRTEARQLRTSGDVMCVSVAARRVPSEPAAAPGAVGGAGRPRTRPTDIRFRSQCTLSLAQRHRGHGAVALVEALLQIRRPTHCALRRQASCKEHCNAATNRVRRESACRASRMCSRNQTRHSAAMCNNNIDAARWNAAFSRLCDYVETHGTAAVPSQHVTADGFGLGVWAVTQRSRRRNGRLAGDLVARLESQPGWSWGCVTSKRGRPSPVWDEGLRHLRMHVKQTGSARVPAGYVTRDGFDLARWVSYVRNRWGRGTLGVHLQDQLTALPGWSFDAYTSQFDRGLEHLRAYAAENGSATFHSRTTTRDGFNLGRWASSVRRLRAAGRLDESCRAAVEATPGWSWDGDVHRKSRWYQHLGALERYAADHGTALVPQRYVTDDGAALGEWVQYQRSKYANGTLSAHRCAALNAVPGWVWNIYDDAWDRGLNELQRVVDETGAAVVSSRFVTGGGYALGKWVRRARYKYTLGALPDERVAALEALPGWAWCAPPGPRHVSS